MGGDATEQEAEGLVAASTDEPDLSGVGSGRPPGTARPSTADVATAGVSVALGNTQRHTRLLATVVLLLVAACVMVVVKRRVEVVEEMIEGGEKEHVTHTISHSKGDPNSAWAADWGHFAFEDPDPKAAVRGRPQPNWAAYEHRDVPTLQFPKGAWQSDGEYMDAFIREARALVNRTMEAIYAEYGVGVPTGSSQALTDEQLKNRAAFMPFVVIGNWSDPNDEGLKKPRGEKGAMWSTQSSWDGLARRLIHAIMTGDTFQMTLGGHSAAAGHGNNFNQSYWLQAGLVLEPVFAHLGIELTARNLAQGGMGTLQQAMAGMDLRGKETDLIMWDSRMTEKSQPYFTFFMKQALMAGNRAPFLFGEGMDMRALHIEAGADVGEHGSGWNGPVTKDANQVKTLPYAAQYLNCDRDAGSLCKDNEYNSGCWVERPDLTPPTPQDQKTGGQASWHPGNRVHQIRSRRIAMFVLRGLDYALEKWSKLTAEDGHPLADEHWHVSDHYKAIRERAPGVSGCVGDDWALPSRICTIPLKGRSEWMPRADYEDSSIRSIIKPHPSGFRCADFTPPNWYEPPDLPAPWNTPPDGEVNVREIAGGRRLNDVSDDGVTTRPSDGANGNGVLDNGRTDMSDNRALRRNLQEGDEIAPGLGTCLTGSYPGVCDGTSASWCNRIASHKCAMAGHNDGRGRIIIDGLSGWVVFQLKDVKEGFIAARMEPWAGPNANVNTEGWTEVNNGGKGNPKSMPGSQSSETQTAGDDRNQRRRGLALADEISVDPHQRELKWDWTKQVFTMQYALNGKVMDTWNTTRYLEVRKGLAYNVECILFLDDKSQGGQDYELAVRMVDCGRECTMAFTHIYWA